MVMASPSWKYFCHAYVHLLSHISRASCGLTLTLAVEVTAINKKNNITAQLWQGGQPHSNLPWPFAYLTPTALSDFFKLIHVLFEVSKLGPGRLTEASIFWERWKDYFRQSILRMSHHISCPVSVLPSTIACRSLTHRQLSTTQPLAQSPSSEMGQRTEKR